MTSFSIFYSDYTNASVRKIINILNICLRTSELISFFFAFRFLCSDSTKQLLMDYRRTLFILSLQSDFYPLPLNGRRKMKKKNRYGKRKRNRFGSRRSRKWDCMGLMMAMEELHYLFYEYSHFSIEVNYSIVN